MTDRRSLTLATEVALTATSVVVAVSLERLFTDTTFLRDLLVMVVGSHLVAAVCRRGHLSMAWATPASGLAMVVLATALFYPDAAALVFPTRETATLLGDDLREAWRVFSDDSAPVPPLRGFVITASVLMWYGAFLADWAAFRLRSPLEAVAPATAVFVFASLLGVDRHALAHGALFALGVGAVLLTMRAGRQAREEVWIAARETDGIRTTLGVGAAIGVLVVLAGVVAAPRLPGADAEPLIDVTEINQGPETRAVVSPLVEIATSLVDQPDIDLFRVRVDPEDRDYWRLMALTTFEGDIWRRSSNFDEARGPVPSDVAESVDSREVEQTVTNLALGNIYLPVAYEPSDIRDNGGLDLEYEAATGALVIARGVDDIPPGYTYTVASEVPDYDPASLPPVAAAGLDAGFVAEHTQLPADWPERVTALARDVTAGATTDHERVRALQSHFLDPANYTYDLDVAQRQNVTDIEDFLFEVRRGYCEQFAATFAAMARSLGIPARVAVGFTWGEWDPETGEYVVRGEHAHAWPEVYFADTGWIVFDPTPGRARPHDADVTGLAAPAQAGDEPTDPVAPPTSVTVPAPEPSSAPTPRPPAADDAPAPASTEPGGAADTAGSWRYAAWALGLVAIVGAAVAVTPGVRWIRRRRRLGRVAADPVGRGELAWDDALDALRLVGLTPGREQTPWEFAGDVARDRRAVGPMPDLAEAVTQLRYAPLDDPVAPVQAAATASAEVVRTCHHLVGPRRVWLDAIDPRTLTRR